MIVLALDTSGAACSVALRDSAGRLLAHRFEALARGHAELLMPMLRDAMAEAHIGFAALSLIAVTTGPGSFTGIRVGLAAARALALASGLPILGITAFDTLAAAVTPAERGDRALLVAIDSRRGDLFVQVFPSDDSPLAVPAAVTPEGMAAVAPRGPLLLAGDGGERAAAILASAGRPVVLAEARLVDAADVAAVALARWRPGERPPPPLPLYLRPPRRHAAGAAPGAAMSEMRVIAPSDSAVIAALHRECFPDDPWSVTAVSDVLAMPGAFGFLALGEAVAGAPAVPHGFLIALAVAGECEILALGVRAAARRRGIARRLLDRLLATDSAISAVVLLEVAEDNGAALALYERAGFHRVGRRRAYYRRAGSRPAAALQLRRGSPPSRGP